MAPTVYVSMKMKCWYYGSKKPGMILKEQLSSCVKKICLLLTSNNDNASRKWCHT